MQEKGVLLPLQAHTRFAVVAQMVEHQLPKLMVVGSIPIYRSKSPREGTFFLSSSDGSPEYSGSQAEGRGFDPHLPLK